MITTFLASRLAGPVVIALAAMTLAGGIWGTVQHFRIAARDAQIEAKSIQLDAALATNKTNLEAIAALQAQQELERTTLKKEAEAAIARASKAEKARNYVRSAPPSSDTPLDPALRDALISLRKPTTSVGDRDKSGPTVDPRPASGVP
jgi:hypothetical protein